MSRRRSAAAKLAEAAPVFAALGDETRLRLVTRLCVEGPLSISRLHEGSDITRQGITRHLHALGDAGLVRDTRRGREHIWSVEPTRIELARRCLDQISAQWDAALHRLKNHVESDA
jgi:DNA-binding transcriptional ArsR family regulator